jgi:hypothetical protein
MVMDELIELYQELKLVRTSLVILDVITGAGYIVSDDDRIVVRWGSYNEGIRILRAFRRADSMPNV